MILPSGGHDHTIQPQQDSLGVLTIYGANPATANGTITARTDANGKIQFGYRAPIFGGEIEFVATTVSEGDTLVARDTLVVRVPDLVNFADTQTNFWRLTGNQPTTSYRGCPGAAIRHPDNHYGTQSLVDTLQLAILDFFEWSLDTSQTGLNEPGLLLGINDMSLVNGGLFDICSTWIPGHYSHRKGTSVDIDGTVSSFNNPGGPFITLTGDHIDKLTRFMRKRGGRKVPEEPIHYEF